MDLGNASNAFTISAANAGRDSNTDSGFTYVRMVNNIARVLHHPPNTHIFHLQYDNMLIKSRL
jgi:hypothetical protein